jgi:hypothetical protein
VSGGDPAAAIRQAAIAANGRAWTLLRKAGRSAAETAAMIAAAEESHRLWRQVGTPVNDQRGAWLVARVLVDAGRAEAALAAARETLALTVADAGLADFDFAFAHEVMARALAATGDEDAARRHYAEARRLGGAIADDGDRAEFSRQLKLPPWFGLEEAGDWPGAA